MNIRNNIFCYFKNHGPFQIINNSAINGLHIEKNLSYNLSNFNILPYFWTGNIGTLTGYTYNDISTSNTTQQNPLLDSTFHLSTGSPALNAGSDGLNIGKY